MSDLDMVEQFLNLALHHDIQQFFGINELSCLRAAPGKTAWLLWTKFMMGLVTSPYYAVKR
jgi:hypothetical protein